MSDGPPPIHQRPLDDRLADKNPRRRRPADNLSLKNTVPLRMARADDIAVAAVGALLLRKIDEFGQTALFSNAIQSLIDRTTESLTAREVMMLEVEAYEILDWLVGHAAQETEPPEPVAVLKDGRVYYDPNASTIELIMRAIHESFDLKVDYFSRSRGEMNTRRIRPIRVEAETYVRAYCHARKDERTFRLNRITRCIPVGGRLLAPTPLVSSTTPEGDVPPRQMSLLDDD